MVAGDSALVIFLRQKGHGHALCLTVTLNHGAGESLQRSLHHRARHGAAAILEVPQATEVVVFKSLDRHHPVDHGGDAQKRRHPLLLNHVQCQLGVKIDQHHGAAVGHVIHGECHRNVEHLPGEHVHVGGYDAFGDGLIQHAHIKRVVRVQSALGLTGGAAGVQDEHRVIPADPGSRCGFFIARPSDQLLVVAVSGGGKNQRCWGIRSFGETARELRILLGANQYGGLAILKNPRHLGLAQPPVERLGNQAAARAGVEHLHVLDAVLGENGNAITLVEFELITECVGEPANTLVKGTKGHAAVVGDINQRLALRV